MTADEGPAGLRRIAASAMVDGIVLMDVEMRDARVPLLRELDRPSVLIGFPSEPAGLTCVDLDFFRAGVACVEHLADLGHREIALLGAPRAVYERGTGFAHRTMAGFRDAAESRGARCAVIACEENYDAVQRQLIRIFNDRPGADRARGAQRGGRRARAGRRCAALGRSVPRDVSVVAICPDEVAERSTPPLDSVLIPAEEVGNRAVELLMRKIEGGAVPDATPARRRA